MAKKDYELFGDFGHHALNSIARKICELTTGKFSLEDVKPEAIQAYTFEGETRPNEYTEMTVVFRVYHNKR